MFLKMEESVPDLAAALLDHEDGWIASQFFESLREYRSWEDCHISFSGKLLKMTLEISGKYDVETAYAFEITDGFPFGDKPWIRIFAAYLEISGLNYVVLENGDFLCSFVEAEDLLEYLNIKKEKSIWSKTGTGS